MRLKMSSSHFMDEHDGNNEAKAIVNAMRGLSANRPEIEQLIKKGYLTGEPDGIYGPGTAECAKAWQKDNGYDPDGKLTTEQQKKLFDVA